MTDEFESPESPDVDDTGQAPYPAPPPNATYITSPPAANTPGYYGVPPGPDGTQRHEGIHIVCDSYNAAAMVKGGSAQSCSMYPGNVPVTVSPRVAVHANSGTSPWAVAGGAIAAALVLAIIVAVYVRRPSKKSSSRHSAVKRRAGAVPEDFAEPNPSATAFSDPDEDGDAEDDTDELFEPPRDISAEDTPAEDADLATPGVVDEDADSALEDDASDPFEDSPSVPADGDEDAEPVP